MYKLTFYVPETHIEEVKSALFDAGAGRYAHYDCCAWQVSGTGQFRPLEGSCPHLGETGRVEQVREYRVEMLCAPDRMTAVCEALRATHPYEEPAFDFVRVETAPSGDAGTGGVGTR